MQNKLCILSLSLIWVIILNILSMSAKDIRYIPENVAVKKNNVLVPRMITESHPFSATMTFYIDGSLSIVVDNSSIKINGIYQIEHPISSVYIGKYIGFIDHILLHADDHLLIVIHKKYIKFIDIRKDDNIVKDIKISLICEL